MNSSNSAEHTLEDPMRTNEDKHRQKTKQKAYICPCRRSYGSYPALYSHIKRKHDGKAPGEVIKPKPLRRRGRPFKYQQTELESHNPGKTAEKPSPKLLKKIQIQNIQESPSLHISNQHKHKQQNTFGKLQNKEPWTDQHQMRINIGRQSILMEPQPNYQQSSRYFPRMDNHHQHINPSYYRIEIQQSGKNSMRYSPGQRFIQCQVQSGQMQNLQHYYNERQGNVNCLRQDIGGNQLFNYYQHEKQRQGSSQGQNACSPFFDDGYHYVDGHFQRIYHKKFQDILRAEMWVKFGPIQQGMIEFLQPILEHIVNNQADKMIRSSVIEVNEGGSIKNEDQKNKQEQLLNDKDRQVSLNSLRNENPQADSRTSPKKQAQPKIQISHMLQNQHFMDIYKWLISSSADQHPIDSSKQNYIQRSFRCCIIEFLDFIDNFLQTTQYQQVLLMLLFFCDNILASTRIFQDSPQPQIYQMSLYYNGFMDSYLPKLMKSVQYGLDQFFLFKQYRKRAGQLITWMQIWISLQQYYHHKYYREMVKYEIQRQSLKHITHQRSDHEYITQRFTQGQQHDSYSQNFTINRHHINANTSTNRNTYPNGSYVMTGQNSLYKTQDNPQMVIFNQINVQLVDDHLPMDDNEEVQEVQDRNVGNDAQDKAGYIVDQLQIELQDGQRGQIPQSVQHSLKVSQMQQNPHENLLQQQRKQNPIQQPQQSQQHTIKSQ